MDSLTLADGVDQSLITAGLRRFRGELYRCLGRRRDVLFELVDALLAAEAMPSLPHLSLLPTHRRGWGSVYAALAAGEVDAERVAELLVAHRGGGAPVFAVDARRVRPGEDIGQATAAQIRAVTGRLDIREAAPMFVFDAGYDPIALTVDLADTPVAVLVRIRGDRVFYTDPATRAPGQLGRPRRHGARLLCAESATWPAPEQTLEVDDEQYGRVQVAAWAGLHPKLAGRGHWIDCPRPPIVAGTVIRVQVEHLPGPRGRAVKTLWLWWAGPGTPDLDRCWRAYIRRFDLEHTFGFCKQALGWTTPRIRTPEQADRWTWLVLAAYTQLRLARSITADTRLPWERRLPTARLTPTRIRRGFAQLLPVLCTPASPPKPCGRSPGRPKGSRRGPAPRHPAIHKAAA